jgi:quinoprotein relay system zinc metallohydrolase 2
MVQPARSRSPGRARTLVAALSLFPLILPAAAATFAVREVAPGVYLHQGSAVALDAPGHDDIANIGFIVGSRCVAVIDTGGSVRIGRALAKSVRERTPLPVCYVINTHVHVDHVLGNPAFVAAKPQFVGHERLAEALSRSREFFVSHYGADLDAPPSATQIIGPSRMVAIGTPLTLDLGARQLVLRAWPTAHSDCDLTVFDDSTGTLWAGDLLFVQRTPVLDGSLKGWLSVMDALAALPVQHVIPGHGGAGDDLKAALEPQRRYLQALLGQVRQDLAQGMPLQEALRQPDIPGRADWQLWQETHPRNIGRAYQELEWE